MKSQRYQNAALLWLRFRLSVIPIVQGTKRTAVKWDWCENLSEQKVINYWDNNPDHELGFIVSHEIIVIDPDTPEAVAALAQLEWEHGVVPNLVVKTRNGEHHYFKRALGAYAKTSGHGKRPDQKIDIKTGRTIVVLPPSTGKTIKVNDAKDAGDLVEASQSFIDAVSLHKGHPVPRPHGPLSSEPRRRQESSNVIIAKLRALLEHLDPDCGYEIWLRAQAAIFHETGGSEEGFALADTWSGLGKKYVGSRDVLKKWQSFDLNHANPCTIGTLCWMVNQSGGDSIEILAALEPGFEKIEVNQVDQ